MYYYFSKLLIPLILPINFIIIFLTISFFFKKLKKVFYFLLFFLTFISIFPVGNFLVYHFLNKPYLDISINKPIDSILVLGGDERRILHGIGLLNSNPDAKIIFSGGTSFLNPNINQIKNDERKNFYFLVQKLLDKDQIIVLERSRNTYENIKNFQKINKKLSFKNTVVVTDMWHYKRTLKIAKSLNLNLTPYAWKGVKEENFLQHYQTYDFAYNLIQFNRFFREFYGIIALSIFNL